MPDVYRALASMSQANPSASLSIGLCFLCSFLQGHTSSIGAVAFSRDARQVCSGSASGQVLVHILNDSAAPVCLETVPGLAGVTQLQWSPFHDGHVAVADVSGRVAIWDVARKDCILSQPMYHSGAVTGLAYSPLNDKLFVTASRDQQLKFMDVRAGRNIHSIDTNITLTALSFRFDGVTLAVGTLLGSILIYDLRQKAAVPLHRLTAHDSAVAAVEFTHRPPLGSSSKSTSLPQRPVVSATKARGGQSPPSIGPLDNQGSTPAATSTPGADTAVAVAMQPRVSRLAAMGDDLFSPLAASGVAKPVRKVPDAAVTATSPPGRPVFASHVKEHAEALSPFSAAAAAATAIAAATITPATVSDERGSLPSSKRTPSSSSTTILPPAPLIATKTAAQPTETAPRPFPATEAIGHGSRPIPRNMTENSEHIRLTFESAVVESDEKRRVAATTRAANLPAVVSISSKPPSQPVEAVLRPQFVAASAPVQLPVFQMDLIQSMVDESLDRFRATIHADVVNMHVELIRQFQIQQSIMTGLFQHHSVNEALVTEIESLKEQIQQLQAKY